MSAITTGRLTARDIRPTAYERGMLWIANVLEGHVARRVARRDEDVRRSALRDRSGMGAREEHLMRARSLNLRVH